MGRRSRLRGSTFIAPSPYDFPTHGRCSKTAVERRMSHKQSIQQGSVLRGYTQTASITLYEARRHVSRSNDAPCPRPTFSSIRFIQHPPYPCFSTTILYSPHPHADRDLRGPATKTNHPQS